MTFDAARSRWAGEVLALAAAYAVLGKLGLQLGAVSGFATLVWPPTGVALAALVVGGLRLWPGVVLGAVVVNLWTGAPALVAVGIGVGNCSEAVLGAFLLQQFGGVDPSLRRLRGVIGLFIATLLTPPVSATIGVSSLVLGGIIHPSGVVATWRAWWLGDTLGDLVVAPVLLVWLNALRIPGGRLKRRWERSETAVLYLSAVAVMLAIFGPWIGERGLRQSFLLFPLLIWAALRFGQRGATAMTVLVSATAIGGTALGYGPFVQSTLAESLFPLQSFMAVLAVTVLILAATISERDLAIADRELAERRASFMAQAGLILGESLGYQLVLEKLARLMVPEIADWCTVVAVDDRGLLRRVAVIHKDPAKASLTDEYRRLFPPEAHRAATVETMRSSQGQLTPVVAGTDLETAAQSPEHLRLMQHLGVTSAIIVPMMARGQLLGSISLLRSEGEPYGPADLSYAQSLATRAALAVDNSLLFEEVQREEQRRRFLADAGLRLVESLDSEKTLAAVVEMTVPQLADFCTVDLLDASGDLTRVAIAHVDPEKVAWVRELSQPSPAATVAREWLSRVVRSGAPVLVPEIDQGQLAAALPDPQQLRLLQRLELKSAMAVPMRARGHTLGVLILASSKAGRHYSNKDLVLACELANRAGIAVDSARLYREAQEAIAGREEIMAAVSHDLKNPLTAILARAKLLRRPVPAEEQVDWIARHTDGIRHSALRMVQLSDEILEGELAASGRMELQLRSWPVAELLEDALDGFHSAAEEQSLQLEDRTREEELYASCDAPRVRRILSNLIGNAVKFTPRGGTVWLEAVASGKSVKVCVNDTGPGIPVEDQPHLFERYWRGRSGGTGLGLFIVRRLVDAHGGQVWVESEPGQGSHFCFTLPVGTPPA